MKKTLITTNVIFLIGLGFFAGAFFNATGKVQALTEENAALRESLNQCEEYLFEF